jgi:DNA-binding protein HU-beta
MSATQTAESPKRTKAKAPAPKAAAKTATPKKLAAPKKAAPKAAPKKPVETITLKTVFEQLADAQDLSRKQGQALLAGFVASVTSILKGGDRVRLTGLGILEVKDRPARMGRNPATGAAIQIAASRKVAFRVAKELKDAV